jgi:hypothetical protein
VPRSTAIFDREGYSPDLFLELQKERIAAFKGVYRERSSLVACS